MNGELDTLDIELDALADDTMTLAFMDRFTHLSDTQQLAVFTALFDLYLDGCKRPKEKLREVVKLIGEALYDEV